MSGLEMRQFLLVTGLLVILCIALGLAGWLLWTNGLLFPAAPTPSPTATQAATSSPTSAVNSWVSIQAAGKLVAGTSGDYPPFGFYNGEFRLDGFEPAVIQAVGRVLGLQVELIDVPHEYIGNALLVGQIDVAIAALGLTPESQAAATYSNSYYQGEDGILARADSPISTVSSVDALAGRRVGVQRFTAFENWLRTTLIETGRTPANNLITFSSATDLIGALEAGQVEVIVVDLQAALAFSSAGGMKLVGRGLYPLSYGIAMRPGDYVLQDQINRALETIRANGTLASLTQQYLGLSPGQVRPPPPTPTQGSFFPTPPPTPQGCINGMEFVEDLTLDDFNMAAPPQLPPSTPFLKGWRIRNIGTCTWDGSYRLVYVQGNTPAAQMGGQPIPIQGSIPPGQTYDIYVNLFSPAQPGIYQGFWQMSDARSIPFGPRIWVGIQVVGAPLPPTPTTSVLGPVIDAFALNPTAIQVNGCTDITWATRNTTSIRIWRSQALIADNMPSNGAIRDCPPVSGALTYRLDATGSGQTVSRTATLTVGGGSSQPGLAGTAWLLTAYSSSPGTLVGLVANTQIDAAFGADGVLRGSAGCNQYTASYTERGNLLTVSAPTSTQQNCLEPPGIMQQEQSYLARLPSASRFDQVGNQLFVYDSNGFQILIFRR